MSKFRILIVENDDDIREIYASKLELEGYEVDVARDPEEAKQKLSDKLFHLALIDVRLRHDRIETDRSGLTLCDEIEPTVPRIILTAFQDANIVRDALQPRGDGRRSRADGFLFKRGKSQQESEQFLEEIKRVLRAEYEIVPTRRIAVLTSGGDAPGMNAAIWSIVRTAMKNEIEVIGVMEGYDGLINNWMKKLRWDDVSDIMTESGTVLRSARSDEFREEKFRAQAVDNVLSKHIDALIVVGGDGSMQGASALARDLQKRGKHRLQTIALPGTIDNDLFGTDMSLGAASAANAMINQVRQIIQPAKALRMVFVIDVMGALSGFLALETALAVGADAVIIPEELVVLTDSPPEAAPTSWKDRVDVQKTKGRLNSYLDRISQQLETTFAAGKEYALIVQAEGLYKITEPLIEKMRAGGNDEAYSDNDRFDSLDAKYVRAALEMRVKQWKKTKPPAAVRVQPLGYTVRGAWPSRLDIWLGAALGEAAINSILEGKTNTMIGWTERDGITITDFDQVVRESNRPPMEIWSMKPAWQSLLETQRSLSAPLSADID